MRLIAILVLVSFYLQFWFGLGETRHVADAGGMLPMKETVIWFLPQQVCHWKCDGKLCNRKNIVCSHTNPDWCLSTYLPSLSTITTVVVPPPGGMATATSGRNSVSVNSSVSSGLPSSIMSTSMHCVDRELLPTGRVRSCKTADSASRLHTYSISGKAIAISASIWIFVFRYVAIANHILLEIMHTQIRCQVVLCRYFLHMP